MAQKFLEFETSTNWMFKLVQDNMLPSESSLNCLCQKQQKSDMELSQEHPEANRYENI